MAKPSPHIAPIVRMTLLAGLLLVVCLPRFNLRDSGPLKKATAEAKNTPYGLPLDVAGYIRLTEYFRGQTPADSLLAPFCYRPLVPVVASLLPLPPQTAINVVAIISLFLAVVMLDQILASIGFSQRPRSMGALLFIVSFPTFYYGAIGFVDPPAVLLVTLGVFLSIQRKYAYVWMLALIAVLVKETNGLIALFPLVHSWATRELNYRVLLLTCAFSVLIVITALALRIVTPFPDPHFFLVPRLSTVAENLSRPRALLSLTMTLGLPGLVALMSVIGGRAKRRLQPWIYRFLLIGSALAASLYVYTLFSAYADGRIIWIIYPFAIPLALTWIEAPDTPIPASEARLSPHLGTFA